MVILSSILIEDSISSVNTFWTILHVRICPEFSDKFKRQMLLKVQSSRMKEALNRNKEVLLRLRRSTTVATRTPSIQHGFS